MKFITSLKFAKFVFWFSGAMLFLLISLITVFPEITTSILIISLLAIYGIVFNYKYIKKA